MTNNDNNDDTTSTTSIALTVKQLHKSFSEVNVVKGLDLTINKGEFYSLLGPNGAGKTTTLRMLSGLLRFDQGEVKIMGHDIKKAPQRAKQHLGYLADDPALYGKMRPLEYLQFVAGLWGVPIETATTRGKELLDWLDLTKKADEYADNFSRGMRQKLALAGALIHDPDVLILDEPITGLDTMMARQVKELLQNRTKSGKTVILTTHLLEIAESLSDRIGVICDGKLLVEGTLDELKVKAQEDGDLESLFVKLVSKEEHI